MEICMTCRLHRFLFLIFFAIPREGMIRRCCEEGREIKRARLLGLPCAAMLDCTKSVVEDLDDIQTTQARCHEDNGVATCDKICRFRSTELHFAADRQIGICGWHCFEIHRGLSDIHTGFAVRHEHEVLIDRNGVRDGQTPYKVPIDSGQSGKSVSSKQALMNELVITHRLSVPFNELILVTSRSGGPGGQNVNKLETRVELRFDIGHSQVLLPEEKAILIERLHSRLDRHGVLRIVSQESRSQWKNKQIVLEKFTEIVRNALKPRKKRKPTKPSKNSREQRLKAKRIRSERKKNRRPTDE